MFEFARLTSEENGVLWDEGDRRSEIIETYSTDVDSIDGDRAAGGGVKRKGKSGQREKERKKQVDKPDGLSKSQEAHSKSRLP